MSLQSVAEGQTEYLRFSLGLIEFSSLLES